jgi:hypothetical protein
MVGGVVGVSEILSFLTFSLLEGQLTSHRRTQTLLQAALLGHPFQTTGAPVTSTGALSSLPKLPFPEFSAEVLHPYLGYALRSGSATGSYTGFRFLQTGRDDLPRRSEGAVIVGIFGGSVAANFIRDSSEELRAEIQTYPLFAGKEIVIVPVALGGFKQPQQLMALNYFLSLGAEFDVVINIDGFNEMVLPPVDNVSHQVFPFFPRAWLYRVQDVPDPYVLSLMGQISYLRQKRAEWAQVLAHSPLRFSMTVSLFWRTFDLHMQRKIDRRQSLLLAYTPPVEDNELVTGPPRRYENEEELVRDLAQQWMRSSLQMHRLSEGSGILYVHVLQPNVYVAGSKPLTVQERRIALGDHPYREWAERGYPMFREVSRELRSAGVRFLDLTDIFSHVSESLYYDFCHVVKRGSDRLARAIGTFIVEELRAERNVAAQSRYVKILKRNRPWSSVAER